MDTFIFFALGGPPDGYGPLHQYLEELQAYRKIPNLYVIDEEAEPHKAVDELVDGLDAILEQLPHNHPVCVDEFWVQAPGGGARGGKGHF